MTSTDELRRLLDEHGVEYEVTFFETFTDTEWCVNDASCTYTDIRDTNSAYLTIQDITPDQAIAATLGSGTLTAEQVSLYLKALALDLQSPNPFKSLEEKQAIIEKYAHEIAELGSERDEIYNAGFDNGVKACLQILDGYLEYPHSAAENIQKWVDEQWKEYES